MHTKEAKAIARNVLPPLLYSGIRECWRSAKPARDLLQALALTATFITKKADLPNILLYFGAAPGDDLLCTAVLRELESRARGPVWIMSNHPELFEGNSDTANVVSPRDYYQQFAKMLRCDYRPLEYAKLESDDKSVPPFRHIIAELCARAGISGAVLIRPYLALSDREKMEGAWSDGKIAIQSSGLGAIYPMRNKQWYPERFQALVDALRNEYEFIQLGSISDPPLKHVRDLRGATSIRQSAAILHHTRLYIGNVGFPMHLARSVDCPSVIVYGGREAPWQSGYSCNVNLYTPLPCAPCWRWNNCEFDRKCMRAITVDDAVKGVRELIRRPRASLAVEKVIIASPGGDS